MLEIVRDSMWQFVGVILAIIAIIITVILFFNQRQRKALSCQIISNTPLLKIDEEIKRDLQILFKGKAVQDIQLIIARIINTGTVPIKSSDYECPINFHFGEDVQILTAEVTETNPNSLKASANIERKEVTLTPTLMNSGDWITLKILVNQFDESITVDSRIVGVKEIKKYTDVYKNKLIANIVILILGIITGIAVNLLTNWIIK